LHSAKLIFDYDAYGKRLSTLTPEQLVVRANVYLRERLVRRSQ
jgi:hypothetical protein